jgi:hypothetical protein
MNFPALECAHRYSNSQFLPPKFQRELDLSAGRACRGYLAPGGERGSGTIEKIRIPGPYRRNTKIRVIENIEEFRPELNIEALRNLLDRLILED